MSIFTLIFVQLILDSTKLKHCFSKNLPKLTYPRVFVMDDRLNKIFLIFELFDQEIYCMTKVFAVKMKSFNNFNIIISIFTCTIKRCCTKFIVHFIHINSFLLPSSNDLVLYEIKTFFVFVLVG